MRERVPRSSPLEEPPIEWIRTPAPNQYVNSVAISANGQRMVAGSYLHDYTNSRRPSGPRNGTFATTCYDASGHRLWRQSFEGFNGVYWVDVSFDGRWAAAGGLYSQQPYNGFVAAYEANSGEQRLWYLTQARTNEVRLSSDGSVLVAGAEAVHLVAREGNSFANVKSRTLESGGFVETVAVSPDGEWIAYGGSRGHVVLCKVENGDFGDCYTYEIGYGKAHRLQFSGDGRRLVMACSDGHVYLFDRDKLIAEGEYLWRYYLGNTSYYAAISEDGSWIAALENIQERGKVSLLWDPSIESGTAALEEGPVLWWCHETLRNPNSVSMDAAARFVSVADGHPDGKPGHFSLYQRQSGRLLWRWQTSNMSWPMFLSADGSAAFAGSDNGNVYRFAAGGS